MNTMSVEDLTAIHTVLNTIWNDHTLKKDYSSWWNANIDTILTAHLATKRIVRNNQIEIKVTA